MNPISPRLAGRIEAESEAQARIAALEDQLLAYQNGLRLCREAMSLVMMRQKMWREINDPGYTVIDGGSIDQALEFTRHMDLAFRDNLRADLRLAQERIAALTEVAMPVAEILRRWLPWTTGSTWPESSERSFQRFVAALTAPDLAVGERWKATERVIEAARNAVGIDAAGDPDFQPGYKYAPALVEALAALDKVTG